MKKSKEVYKQIPEILVETMENNLRDVRKIIMLYIDKINHSKPSAKMQLLGALLAQEQEILEMYMKDYKEMREFYEANGILPRKDNAIIG